MQQWLKTHERLQLVSLPSYAGHKYNPTEKIWSGCTPSWITWRPSSDGRTAVCLAHPRWEFVFQPKYAAYLNLIEPWWKILRSLALKGRRFETWDEVCQAIRDATAYWNAHRHPFVWGRRRRHQPRRGRGVGLVPQVA